MSDYFDHEREQWKSPEPEGDMDFGIEDPVSSEYYKLMQGASMVVEAMDKAGFNDELKIDFVIKKVVPLFSKWEERVERFARVIGSTERDLE